MINRERIVDVEWAGDRKRQRTAVKLLAVTENRTGMIAGITGAISDLKDRNSRRRASVASDEKGHVEVTVEVFDVKHWIRSSTLLKVCPVYWTWNECQGAV